MNAQQLIHAIHHEARRRNLRPEQMPVAVLLDGYEAPVEAVTGQGNQIGLILGREVSK